MTEQDEQIDQLLKTCQAPKPSHDLAIRISRAALNIEQHKPVWMLVKDIFAEYHLPSPAYSFAFILFIGFAGGFISYSGVESETVTVMSELMYDEGDLL